MFRFSTESSNRIRAGAIPREPSSRSATMAAQCNCSIACQGWSLNSRMKQAAIPGAVPSICGQFVLRKAARRSVPVNSGII